MSVAITNARFLALNQIVRVLAQAIAFLAYARLLAPEEYGVAVMVFTVLNFANVIRDVGVSSAIIQRAEVSEEFLQGAFRICLGTGVVISVSLCSGAMFFADFFDEPRLATMLMCSSVAFLVSAFGMVNQALVERRSEFFSVAKTESLGLVCGVLAGVTAAFFSFGAISVVVQQTVNAVVVTVLYRRCERWRPSLSASTSFDGVFSYNVFLLLFQVVNYFGRNLDSIIIGRVLGSAQLGIYNIAYRIMLFPVQNVTAVTSRMLFPALSRVSEDRGNQAGSFLRAIEAISACSSFLMALLGTVGSIVVPLVFGSKWTDAAVLLVWMAPVGYIQSLVSVTGAIYMARAKTHFLFCLGLFSAILFGFGFLISVPFGLEAASKAYLLANVINGVVSLGFAIRILQVSVNLFFRTMVPGALSAILIVLLFVVVSRFEHHASIVFLALFSSACALMHLAVIYRFSPNAFDIIRRFLSFNRAGT